MNPFYLYEYIKENMGLDPKTVELLKYEIDKRIYSYGDQFKESFEVSARSHKSSQTFEFIKTVYSRTMNGLKKTGSDKTVISNAYFSFDTELQKIGFQTGLPFWLTSIKKPTLNNFQILKNVYALIQTLEKDFFPALFDKRLEERIRSIQLEVLDLYRNSRAAALFVPNDLSFFERLIIQIFKELKKPSFVFLHGLPGRYNSVDDNRADRLIVWGEKIKDHYVRAGVDKNKIFVSGHPYYSQCPTDLRFSLENITVVSKSMNGAQVTDEAVLTDRGNLVLYLYSIRNVLKKLGVKNVRFRPHPSENIDWYYRFIDREFFLRDELPADLSITGSSLVIGPTSTMLLETAYRGVNYLVYEPAVNGTDLINLPVVPPFDGSDKRVPVARDENDLEHLLKNKVKLDPAFFGDYVQTPFDIRFLKKMI